MGKVIVIMDEQRSIPHAKLIPNGNFDKNSLEKFAYRWIRQQIREQHLNFNPFLYQTNGLPFQFSWRCTAGTWRAGGRRSP